jgi:hypothetical protein
MPGRNIPAGNDWQCCIIALDLIENQSLDANAKKKTIHSFVDLQPAGLPEKHVQIENYSRGQNKKKLLP